MNTFPKGMPSEMDMPGMPEGKMTQMHDLPAEPALAGHTPAGDAGSAADIAMAHKGNEMSKLS